MIMKRGEGDEKREKRTALALKMKIGVRYRYECPSDLRRSEIKDCTIYDPNVYIMSHQSHITHRICTGLFSSSHLRSLRCRDCHEDRSATVQTAEENRDSGNQTQGVAA
jgi:hypothetical protein